MTDEVRAAAERFVSPKTAIYLYRTGARNPDGLNPDAWTNDAAGIADPDSRRTMIDLTVDSRNNRASYPAFQAYLSDKQPRTLVVWGKNDPVFGPAAAEKIGSFVPGTKIVFYDTGHFALEEQASAIGQEIVRTFGAR